MTDCANLSRTGAGVHFGPRWPFAVYLTFPPLQLLVHLAHHMRQRGEVCVHCAVVVPPHPISNFPLSPALTIRAASISHGLGLGGTAGRLTDRTLIKVVPSALTI